jgi:dipeptidyl aminopeptidase/acylaminoacyl peptidase
VVIDDPTRNIESVSVPPTTKEPQVVAIEYREARPLASVVDIASGVEHPIAAVPGNLVPVAPVSSDHWVGTWYSSRQPEDLVLFSRSDLAAGRWSPVSLTRVWERTSIRPPDLAAAEDFRWRAADGLEIQGWLYRPAGEAKGTVVYVHGGPTYHIEDRGPAQGSSFLPPAVSLCWFRIIGAAPALGWPFGRRSRRTAGAAGNRTTSGLALRRSSRPASPSPGKWG